MSSYGSYILETFVTLLLVCAVAIAMLYGARRLGIGRAKGPVTLVGQLPLDARRAIYLVRVGKQVLVVGASEAGLTRLGEVEESALDLEEGNAKGASFKDVIAQFRSSRAAKNSDALPAKIPDEPGVASAVEQPREDRDARKHGSNDA